jgi:hypothetical protein
MARAEEGLAELHELRDGVLAIANALLKHRRDERSRLSLVQLQSTREPLLREEACLRAMCLSRRCGTERSHVPGGGAA